MTVRRYSGSCSFWHQVMRHRWIDTHKIYGSLVLSSRVHRSWLFQVWLMTFDHFRWWSPAWVGCWMVSFDGENTPQPLRIWVSSMPGYQINKSEWTNCHHINGLILELEWLNYNSLFWHMKPGWCDSRWSIEFSIFIPWHKWPVEFIFIKDNQESRCT